MAETVHVVLDGAGETMQLVGVGKTEKDARDLRFKFLADEFAYEEDQKKKIGLMERYGPYVSITECEVQGG